MYDNIMIPFALLFQTIQLLERINMDDYCEVDQYDYENIFSFLNILKTYHEKLRSEYDLTLYLDDEPHHVTSKEQPRQGCPIWEAF